MDIHVHIHHEHDEQLTTRLDQMQRSIHSLVSLIINQGEIMASEIEDLKVELDAAVAHNTTVDDSVKAALKVLFDKFNAVVLSAKLDPAALTAMRASIATLRGSSDSVVAAVIANTVADHTPSEPPVPPDGGVDPVVVPTI